MVSESLFETRSLKKREHTIYLSLIDKLDENQREFLKYMAEGYCSAQEIVDLIVELCKRKDDEVSRYALNAAVSVLKNFLDYSSGVEPIRENDPVDDDQGFYF